MKSRKPKNQPERFHLWNRAHRGAFLKGFNCFFDGININQSPYVDIRKGGGGLTWSRSFHAAWVDGWRWAEKESNT